MCDLLSGDLRSAICNLQAAICGLRSAIWCAALWLFWNSARRRTSRAWLAKRTRAWV